VVDKRNFLSRDGEVQQDRRTARGPIKVSDEGVSDKFSEIVADNLQSSINVTHETQSVEVKSNESQSVVTLKFKDHILDIKNIGNEVEGKEGYFTMEYRDESSPTFKETMIRLIPMDEQGEAGSFESRPTTMILGNIERSGESDHIYNSLKGGGGARLFLNKATLENLIDGCVRLTAPNKKKGDALGIFELCSNGKHKLLGEVTFAGQLKNVTDATDPQDAITKKQLEDFNRALLDEIDNLQDQIDKNDQDIEDLKDKDEQLDDKIDVVRNEIPDKVSQLQNDSNFATVPQVETIVVSNAPSTPSFYGWRLYYDNDWMNPRLRTQVNTGAYGYVQIYHFHRNNDQWIVYRTDNNTRMYSFGGHTSETFSTRHNGGSSTVVPWNTTVWQTITREHYV
jgi:hypothetical protein